MPSPTLSVTTLPKIWPTAWKAEIPAQLGHSTIALTVDRVGDRVSAAEEAEVAKLDTALKL
jgi:hypothetical protein